VQVLYATTIGKMHPDQLTYLDRWLKCFNNFMYKDKLCLVTTDEEETRAIIEKGYPWAQVLLFDKSDGIFRGQPSGKLLMAEGKNKANSYVKSHPEITWLFLTDSDLEFTHDSIERFLALAGKGYDMIYTTNIGACFFMHREVCESIHFWSAICMRPMTRGSHKGHPVTIEENFEIVRQIEHLNTFYIQPPFRVYPVQANWIRHRDLPWGHY